MTSIAPGRSLTLALLARAAAVWIGTRALISAVLFRAGIDPRRLDVSQVAFVIVATIVVAAADSGRRHERMLLANLGVSASAAGLTVAIVAVLGEIAIRVSAA